MIMSLVTWGIGDRRNSCLDALIWIALIEFALEALVCISIFIPSFGP